MSRTNWDHIRTSTDSGVNWDFIIPSDAGTCEAGTKEVIDQCTCLLESFDDFLTPVRMIYPIRIFQEDPDLQEVHDVEPVETIQRVLRDESGISASDFVASVGVDHGNARWIPRVPFDHNRLKISFDDGCRYIDRSDCVSYVNGEPVDWEPTWDPLSVTVLFDTNRGIQGGDSEHLIHVSVSLRSDIWLEQSERGNVNRAFLSAFLERIENSLPVALINRDVYRTSDFWVDLGIPARADSFEATEIY